MKDIVFLVSPAPRSFPSGFGRTVEHLLHCCVFLGTWLLLVLVGNEWESRVMGLELPEHVAFLTSPLPISVITPPGSGPGERAPPSFHRGMCLSLFLVGSARLVLRPIPLLSIIQSRFVSAQPSPSLNLCTVLPCLFLG